LGGIQNAARQRSVVALHAAMNAWIKIGLATLFVVELGADSSVVLWAYACGTAAVCVSQLYFLHRLLHRREAAAQNRSPGARRWVAEVWGFSWPFAAWGLFTWMQTSSDRWALEFLANTEAVGRYAVLFQLGFTPLTLASGMVVTLLGPIMYQQAGDAADESRIDKVYRSTWAVTILVMGVTLVLAAIFFLCHGWIFRVFASPKFSAASYLLPWMTLAAGLQACHHLLGIRISSVLKTKLILVPQIVSALLISALTVIGTYVDGIEGLIGGLVVASFIYAAWMFVLSENLRSQCPV
jgi:O-antigen/teichoic acid export membrane protein